MSTAGGSLSALGSQGMASKLSQVSIYRHLQLRGLALRLALQPQLKLISLHPPGQSFVKSIFIKPI